MSAERAPKPEFNEYEDGDFAERPESIQREINAAEKNAAPSLEDLVQNTKKDINEYMKLIENYKEQVRDETEKKAKEVLQSILESLQEGLGESRDLLAKLEKRLNS